MTRDCPRHRRLALGLAFALSLTGAGPARAAASPWSQHAVVAVRLLGAAPAPDGARRLGLHFRLAPGWHVYWKHPGDAGAPPQVAVTADHPLGRATLLFPAPRRFDLPGGLVALGYSNEVVYPLRIAPAGAPVLPPRGLSATVDYVACAIECIPFHDVLALDATAPPAEEEALLRRWEARLPLPAVSAPGLRTQLTASAAGDAALVISLSGPAVIGASPELFIEPSPGVAYGPSARHRTDQGVSFRLPLSPEVAARWPERLHVAWTVAHLRGGGSEPLAVAGVAELPLSPGGTVIDGTSASGGTPATVEASRPLARDLLVGALLGLQPAGLALLALAFAAMRSQARPPRPGLLALLSAGGMLTALAVLRLAAATRGMSAPLLEPTVVAALALPALALALLLWLAPDGGVTLNPHWLALMAPLPALGWLSLAGWPGAPDSGHGAAIALGFAAPWLGLAAVRRWTIAVLDSKQLGGLGFLTAGSLIWSALGLAHRLPAARVALVELSWFAVALAVRLAAGGGRARWRWLPVALALAAAGVWAAG